MTQGLDEDADDDGSAAGPGTRPGGAAAAVSMNTGGGLNSFADRVQTVAFILASNLFRDKYEK